METLRKLIYKAKMDKKSNEYNIWKRQIFFYRDEYKKGMEHRWERGWWTVIAEKTAKRR